MKFYSIIGLILFTIFPTFSQNNNALIPFPNSITYSDGFFPITDNTSIFFDSPELSFSAKELQNILNKRSGINVPLNKPESVGIFLSVDDSLEGNEHYRIEVKNNQIQLKGATPEAVYRGIKTIDQLLLGNSDNSNFARIPEVTIDDQPRFSYRALMLDPARHFLPAEDVKYFIDQMAKYKFNVLQLHLTDDQGWRIQLNKHPELSSEESYSREELDDLIKYAADRYIEIVPEIDIPGHTTAFLSVYPELGCVHKQEEEITLGKTDNRMLCASNPQVYTIFKDIIGEVADIFPSSYIHLGGDEAAIPKNWAGCDSCLSLMQKLGYSEPSQLMIPFFDQMLGFVRENNKKPILWCELNNIYPPADDYLFPYPEDVTLVTWRMRLTPTCLDLTNKSNFPLIMAPGEYAYLDYPQFKGDLPEYNNWGMPTTTLTRTYEFDPGYGLPSEDQKHIMGIMGTLWGEAIIDINRATYMAFPRALALAEAGWTPMENRNWESFKERLYPNLNDLMKSGVSFRVPFEIVER